MKNTNNSYAFSGVSPLTAVMCREAYQTSETTSDGSPICVGDLLSTDDPETSTKWRRMNNNPCNLGYANFLSMKCEKNCGFVLNNNDITNKDNGNLSPHLAPPYFLIELQADVGKICDLLNVIGPFWDEHNISNFIFIAVTWANNLLQDWTDNPKSDKQDTEGSKLEDGGHLSRPSKLATGRKKALILVVNKPDWFEPGELTYLGFDNDYSEIPMVESDKIDFSINYGDTLRKFFGGSAYNGTITGSKKILTYTGTTTRECPDTTATGKLSFPYKYLVKIVVEPAKFHWTEQTP
jgi:hypothetical protein